MNGRFKTCHSFFVEEEDTERRKTQFYWNPNRKIIAKSTVPAHLAPPKNFTGTS